MVFEKIVVDILNKYLGDFIENLDSKQLNIGVWGGDVVLKNLILKQSALDDLDLPVKTVFGRIGTLTLKIPWKDPYNSPIEASVESLFLLSKPITEVKYDPIKEERNKFQNKQSELNRLEVARQKEKNKDKEKTDPGFIEKLSAQIVKNLQVSIKNIHIRYEDSITYPGHSFAAGITLGSLIVVTTDSEWKPGIVKDITKIFKVLDLEGFAVYWNCNIKSYTELPNIEEVFLRDIATKSSKPEDYKYILGPINSSAKLTINQKPELDIPAFSTPKIQVFFEMEKIAIGIGKEQYQGIISLADSMDRINKGIPYRKFRPTVPYEGHSKEWWHFAFKCVVETEIRRKRLNWDWMNMSNHRNNCRKYGTLYQQKLQTKKLPGDLKNQLENLEKNLDLVNLVIIRRKIELEFERTETQDKEKSWLGWFWGSNSSKETKTESSEILKEFENAMTPAEKERLYKAIDYQENDSGVTYPETFVATACKFVLHLLEIQVVDDNSMTSVLNIQLKSVNCNVDLRPAANALKVLANVSQLSVDGLEQDIGIPKLISSTLTDEEQLLMFAFETNPIDKKCGQRVSFLCKPIRIIYDALSINEALNIFKVPESSALEQLSEVTANSLNNVKQMTATGLQYAIEKHTSLEVNVDISAPYIIVPYGGKYTGNENVLVINLGRLRMSTEPRAKSMTNVKEMFKAGTDVSDVLRQMIDQSYDKFKLDFSDLQVILAQSGDDWMSCLRSSEGTQYHILNPLTLKISLEKCLISDDPRLPLIKVRGELPSISLQLVNSKLVLLMTLINSIPLPKSEPVNIGATSSVALLPVQKSTTTLTTKDKMLNNLNLSVDETEGTSKGSVDSNVVQFTKLQVYFIMNELTVHLMDQEYSYSECKETAIFTANSLEIEFVQQTFTMLAKVRLKSMEMCQFIPEKIQMLHTRGLDETNAYLINVEFIHVDRISPEFHSLYNSCESTIKVHFARLSLILHLEALKSMLQYTTDLQSQIEETQETAVDLRVSSSRRLSRTISTLSVNLIGDARRIVTRKDVNPMKEKEIHLILSTTMDEFSVKFCTSYKDISTFSLKGLNVNVLLKQTRTEVEVDLNDITVMDLNASNKYTNIISVKDTTALKSKIIIYNINKYNLPEEDDMSVYVYLGQMRIVFLNYFINGMLSFLNEFQTAQKRIIEASQEAAKQAKTQMQAVYQKETRVKLNIDIKAPDIIVPSNSTSFDCLWLDLGHITITNSFKDLLVKHLNGNSVILEELEVNLTDFRLLRATVIDSDNIKEDQTLLNPFNVALYLKRNLSSSWYKDIPELELNLKVPELSLTICQVDYVIIMSVLQENFNEGNKIQEAKTTSKMSSKKLKAKSTISGITLGTVDISTDNENDVHTFLNFNVKMERFVINICSTDVDNGLGKFYLEGISVKGKLLSNNIIAASLLLVNCIIEDTRKGRDGKLNQLMERKVESNDSTETGMPLKSMIDIIFQQQLQDTFIDLKIYSFNLILSMDFLMALSEFFTKAVPAQTAQAKEISRNIKSNTSLKSPSDETKNNLTINIKLEQPDIILVEHMENIDTKAMILNNEINLKMRLAQDKQMITGCIKDFSLYTCCYNPEKRKDTMSYVLHPVNISIAGSTPENAGMHIEVCITQVKLSISPATIELLSRCHATMVGYSSIEITSDDHLEDSAIWEPSSFEENDYWFLKPDDACEALEIEEATTSSSTSFMALKEMCIVRLPSLVVTIETGHLKHTLPMLFLESSFQLSVANWSSQMSVESSLNLQMAYYNSRLALWEPLVEPVQIKTGKEVTFKPWELKLDISMAEAEDVTTPADSDAASTVSPPSMMTIDISSRNNLELTVTKTCLEVLNNLGAAFATAIQPEKKMEEHLSPYKFKNNTGLAVTLLLRKGCFHLLGDENSTEALIESDAEVYLEIPHKHKVKSTINLLTEMDIMNKSEEYYLDVLVNDFNCELSLPIVRADTRYYSLKGQQKDVGLVCDIEVNFGVRIITLRTIIQVQNNFHIPVEVYYMTDRGNELEFISTIAPNTTLNLPYKSVYTNTNEIFFSVNRFTITSIPFVWKELQSKVHLSKYLYCESKNRHLCKDHFVIKAFGETKQIFYENTARYTILSTNYCIRLGPAVVFQNCLPVNIVCCFETTVDTHLIVPGETTPLPNLDPEKSTFVLRIPEYLEKEWSCTVHLSEQTQNFSVWTFQSNDSAAKMFLDLGISIFNKHGFMTFCLYCPFWMVNKTGFMLSYRKSKKTEKHEVSGSPLKASDENLNILHHPPSFKGPILFSFNAKNFFGKKKASIRMANGEWSDKFSLDVAGSSGVVVCKYDNQIYQIGVNNQLTYNGLTKQVTFTPYFLLLNNATFTIECQESDRPADPWIVVDPSGCNAFWPKSSQEDRLIKLRVAGTTEITEPFLISESHTTLLRLNNRYGGINVDIQMMEGAIYINLTSYEVGMAPALLMNYTKNTLSFWEKDTVQIKKLKPNHRALYTWLNPSGQRVLMWDIGKNRDMEDELKKDGVGQFSPKDGETVYWVSFLNGMQRVLLFTLELAIAEGAQSAAKFEVIDREVNLYIHGIGLSLVNNVTRTEIMYLSITSTGIIWEQSKLNGKRYKQMNSKDSNAIENSYQFYLSQRLIQEDVNQSYKIDDKIEVNFLENMLIKPRKRLIRRTFETGLWIQMKTSPNQMQLHGKINRIQIDNQIYDCIFPVVLAPVPPPKSVAMSNVHKPFIEMSIVQLLIKNSQIRQFKYFKILVQEFHIKVDLNFVNALLEVLQTKEDSSAEEKIRFLKDLNLVNEPLYAHASLQSKQEQKNFYDLLHFSPLKIHVSFTLPQGQQVAAPNFLTVLLQGLGVTLTNLQDVVFKLAYFERNYSFLTQKQLTREATTHYVGQAVKQLYVLVFGLDVIGNPYGLVLGITQGFEDLFYEPIQGAIQGPGEFAEGLVLGVRSLFGHTVGGAAGAVSRITGAMGKGIAALTFDKEYQRKRRDQFNKKPATMHEGLARGGKGLVMGVVDGVTGVFTKPISGAKEQGVGGFFKGLGKGAVGLVTRPTAGVIDFTSGSLDAVKRATEMSTEVNRIRNARFCQADGLVRPYNNREADGNKLLVELEKGKYASTDIFVYHYEVIEKKEVFLLTDKRVAYIAHNDIFGGWQIEWSYTWQEFSTCNVTPKGIYIAPCESKKKKMGLFASTDGGKLVLIPDRTLQEEIVAKMEDLKKKAL